MKTILKKLLVISGILAFMSAALISTPIQAAYDAGQRGPGNGQVGNGNRGVTPGYQYTAQNPLTEIEAAGLQNAIREEYVALNTYQAVLDELGQVYPFSRIVLSEAQHVAALTRVAERYGVAVPINNGEVFPYTYASLSEACQMGVALETDDAALYDELLADVTNPALIRVYTQLQAASLNNHLVAFENCK
ncbi:MAG TPA: hypothetical protein PKK90_06185 [Anaerolineaceae bacterium]|nr:hypothetical protein [Anaerolineaceae bacterium]HPT22958.1 hypothetical protein [Anaerolineaceae bacterium]